MNNFQPYISIVIAVDNDWHTRMAGALQLTVDALIQQLNARQLPSELILVEWNPKSGRHHLSSGLKFPSAQGPCRLRILQVPPGIHYLYEHSNKIAFFEMHARNTGIRRALGTFVLSIAPGLLISDQIMDLIAQGQLTPGAIYKANLIESNSASDANAESPLPRIHLDNCADFALMARENWHQLRGYGEWAMLADYKAELLSICAHYSGVREELLKHPIYSVREPDGVAEYDSDIPRITREQFLSIALDMKCANAPTGFNLENWGLSDREVPVIQPGKASSSLSKEQGRNELYFDVNWARLKHLESLGLDFRGKRVLELGANVASQSDFISRAGATVVGIDAPSDSETAYQGSFDVGLGYGTLNRCSDPEIPLRELSAAGCQLVVVDVNVAPDQSPGFEPDAGQESRPSRSWIMSALERCFGFAYACKYQPRHSQFPLNWHTLSLGVATRAVFVGSKTPLRNEKLLPQLPVHQTHDPVSGSRIWIDVGAHRGGISLIEASKDEGVTVFAFEPNIEVLPHSFRAHPNYNLIAAAVSTTDGIAEFHLNVDEGSSSLLPFDPDKLQRSVVGEALTSDAITFVPTMRLDTFMNTLRIAEVEFLKVDAQGKDLDVIQSAGERISSIKRIQIEVHLVGQYAGEHSKQEAVDYLMRNGFHLMYAPSQTHGETENLTFVRAAEKLSFIIETMEREKPDQLVETLRKQDPMVVKEWTDAILDWRQNRFACPGSSAKQQADLEHLAALLSPTSALPVGTI